VEDGREDGGLGLFGSCEILVEVLCFWYCYWCSKK